MVWLSSLAAGLGIIKVDVVINYFIIMTNLWYTQ